MKRKRGSKKLKKLLVHGAHTQVKMGRKMRPTRSRTAAKRRWQAFEI